MPEISDGIAAVILAGGAGRRMGGRSKARLMLGGRPLLHHVLARIGGQVSAIALSTGAEELAEIAPGLPRLADRHADRRGPLAGILAGMAWCRAAQPSLPWLLSLPVDCPFLPRDLVARLAARAARGDARVVIAASGGAEHPAIALWDVTLADDLGAVVAAAEDLSIRRFYRRFSYAVVEFPMAAGRDPFLNLNTPEALARAEETLAMGEDLEPVVARDADQGDAGSLGLPHGEQGGR